MGGVKVGDYGDKKEEEEEGVVTCERARVKQVYIYGLLICSSLHVYFN